MPFFHKKPAVIEAEQFLPNENKIPAGVYSDGMGDPRKTLHSWVINTLEGRMFVNDRDWIITGVKGEQYLCTPEMFAATYSPVTP